MFEIIGKRFSISEFADYVAGIRMNSRFAPQFVVIHNTAAPNLEQRPAGFTETHMANLRDYYGRERGWKGGPHLFIDDNGIWVFNPLDRGGVHSPSWNNISWGVEHLGDYDSDDPHTGRGRKVIDNGTAAVAILLAKINAPVNPKNIRFHYEDDKTTHACPGKRLAKQDFLNMVGQFLEKPATEIRTTWTIVGPEGNVVEKNVPNGAAGTARYRAAVTAIGGDVIVDGENRKITLVTSKPG
jgi:hypothetical protein